MERGYSLWYIPDGDNYIKLRSIIDRLGEKYSSPKFEPHITLISHILSTEKEAIRKSSELALKLSAVEINLAKIDYLNAYFKCLFVRFQEDDELIEANLIAGELFNRKQDQQYMPHLSLMYGTFSEKIKQEIVNGLGNELNIRFKADRLFLYDTKEINPDNWRKIKEFTLSL
ncbi:MAG: hypothetical protein KAK00_05320 [Nanoarchaeota archaeon]|nr:hypothetical protein [Nanoarchaeota archaeon]